jgi:hypothetical protein
MHEEGYHTRYLDDLEAFLREQSGCLPCPLEEEGPLHWPPAADAVAGNAEQICVTRYPHSRFWAVYENGQLLCVAVYKKGALAVMRRLQQARRTPHTHTS